MFTNYLIYLNTLPKDEKVEQILILLFLKTDKGLKPRKYLPVNP